MAETIQEYGIEIGFEDALRKMSKLRSVQKSMNRMQESSLKTQIQLQMRLNSLKKSGMAGVGSMPSMPARTPTRPPSSPNIRVRPQIQDAHVKARADAMKQEAKLAAERNAMAQKLTGIRKSHAFWVNQDLTANQKLEKKVLTRALMEAKSVREMNLAVTASNRRLVAMNKQTKELNKQNFILRRMRSSSEQFAGNIVSAFAITAGATGIVRIGQDFEAVGNTMLSVSANAQEAGDNLQFIREEAYRLGLGLKQSAQGFAKLTAARGDMTLEDTKALFTGMGELSSLLGLTAEESGRALTAIQQMASKGTISAEELNLGSL